MKDKLTIREMCIFAILATIMYCSKVIMEIAPNIHLLGMFTMTFTIVYRKKALIPIYLYVFINGFFAGFATWWVPYLYVWTVLWAVTMLLPKRMPDKIAAFVYPFLCCIHGLSFGVLYAPAQALLFGLDFRGMIAWIAAGSVFDIVHAVGNLVAGILVLPVSKILRNIDKSSSNIR